MSLSAVFKYMAKQAVDCRNMVVTVKPRLHDTTGCQTGCTTGCSIVQPVGQSTASCKQPSNGLSNGLYNRIDNRLYRVNGVLRVVLWYYVCIVYTVAHSHHCHSKITVNVF